MRFCFHPLIAVCGLVPLLGRQPAMAQQHPPSSPISGSLSGFSREHAAQQRALETRFDSALNRANLRDWMKRLSARPHHLGSPYGKENAEFLAAQFRSWGYDTQIETFEVLFPTPKQRLLEITGAKPFTAGLVEPELKEDATSGLTADQLPTYNAYSCDGDVTGKLVYVNYGVPKDYETLEAKGIDVRGKLVIARYGGSWRGIKPKVAAEHGAIGCLIYSDPRDDGFFQGDTYPQGAYRNANGAQRGSVADMPLYPGDPLTPGVGATHDAKRLALKDAPTITKIPTLPISYADALPLLQTLAGPVAPEAWRGALPLTYHIGPGTADVHLKLSFNWNMVTANDVIARLPGSERPDEWVIRGNHHDAWVCGAEDPISGAVALMEEARAVGTLTRTGWRPKRTIVYALWDGEEPGLLGSTEWVETHESQLAKNAVAYINSDSNGRGYLGVGGSHTLERFVGEVAADVIDPEKRITVAERARAARLVQGGREARAIEGLRIEALGSGSDFSPFLQHVGIASIDLGYGGESGGGVYHSVYDSFDWYTRFGDPHFDYGIALAQTAGRMVLRLADADLLPLEFTHLADTVDRYVQEIVKLTDTLREETEERNRIIRDGTLAATFNPTEVNVLPQPKPPVPYLNFAPLQNALASVRESARDYAAATDASLANMAKDYSLPAERLRAIDALLTGTERAMLRPEGLPRRPWYRHQIYAPGFYTGYGVKTLPGVREAIEQRNWREAEAEIRTVADTLQGVAKQIDRAAEALRQGNR
jgi:N-acetylated-alpha-linked acidic dipeptidase